MMVFVEKKLAERAVTQGISTRAVRGGKTGLPGEPLGSQIVMTSSFVLESPESTDIHHGYSRVSNETVAALEKQLCALEECLFAPVYANGVAATNAIFSMLQAGDSVLFEENTYGCTLRLAEEIFTKFGITFCSTDFSAHNVFKKISELKPTLIWIESPTNPLLKIIDIEAVATASNSAGSLLVVDNTFAAPVNQLPLQLGADLVLYSLTKYHAGHSTCMGGTVCTNNNRLGQALYDIRRFNGSILTASEAALIAQGTQTIEVRMERIASNALALAKFLESHPRVTRVLYPGLPSHPEYELATRQMCSGSGIIAVEFSIEPSERMEFLNRIRPLFSLSHSLGSTKSQVSIPALMSHAKLSLQEREQIGLSDSLFRFSIGIEDIDDLCTTLDQALNS